MRIRAFRKRSHPAAVRRFVAVGREGNAGDAHDLPAQRIQCPDGRSIAFEVDAFRKECLLNGWDDIGLTLRHADAIRAFEAAHRERHPYFFR